MCVPIVRTSYSDEGLHRNVNEVALFPEYLFIFEKSDKGIVIKHDSLCPRSLDTFEQLQQHYTRKNIEHTSWFPSLCRVPDLGRSYRGVWGGVTPPQAESLSANLLRIKVLSAIFRNSILFYTYRC